MKRNIRVFIFDERHPVGTLHYDQQGRRESAAFQYADDWIGNPDAFPIDPELPLRPGPHFHEQGNDGSLFQGIIADTEPDGWGKRVINRDHAIRRREALQRNQESEFGFLNALDYLLAVDDVSRSGALRLQDESGQFVRAATSGKRTTPPLLELGSLLKAAEAVETNTETARDLAYLLGEGSPLGGLRPKCTIVDDDGMLALGKFPSVQDQHAVTKGEILALLLAKNAGVNASEGRLVEANGKPIAVIRRFDRTKSGERLLYASAATLLGVDAAAPEDHSYAEIVDAIRRYGHAPAADIEELWRRIAFSILISNTDDHLRNHGFLHVAYGQWRLSPAFDLNPMPYRLRELKLWISEQSGPSASLHDLFSVLPYFGLSLSRAKEILGEVLAAATNWRKVGANIQMSAGELDAFEAAFEHEEKKIARKLASA